MATFHILDRKPRKSVCSERQRQRERQMERTSESGDAEIRDEKGREPKTSQVLILNPF